MDLPTCYYCGRTATCVGLYADELHGNPHKFQRYACDDCCGHSQDGGVCMDLTWMSKLMRRCE